MGGHYLVAAALCGAVNRPVPVEPCKGRGHELKTTHHWLPVLQKELGRSAPQLWLLDPHYFNQSCFKTVRTLEAHLLIMSALLRLFCLALTAFHAFFHILSQARHAAKAAR